jgi:GDP-L-fucose synthase
MTDSSNQSSTSWFSGKKVLVTGGTGTLGSVMVPRLMDLGAQVSVTSIDPPERVQAVLADPSVHKWGDLRDYDTCYEIAENQDCVIHLMAVKGSTQIGTSRVASAYVPFLQCNTNMMEAAFRQGVSRYLFVGSIGEYPAIPVRHEDNMWDGPPQANDRFMGIAKRAGETQAEAYAEEHGWDAVRIVRLSNVYGPYDDFDPRTAQVVPALISRMVGGENPITVAGDGSAVRDLIYSEDAAEGMIRAIEDAPPGLPINIGSGNGYAIKEVAEAIASLVPSSPEIQWDPTRPTGDKKRILATERAKEVLGFEARTSLREGIRKTIEWYLDNSDLAQRRGKELHG